MEVCKTFIPQFDSGWRLQNEIPETQVFMRVAGIFVFCFIGGQTAENQVIFPDFPSFSPTILTVKVSNRCQTHSKNSMKVFSKNLQRIY